VYWHLAPSLVPPPPPPIYKWEMGAGEGEQCETRQYFSRLSRFKLIQMHITKLKITPSTLFQMKPIKFKKKKLLYNKIMYSSSLLNIARPDYPPHSHTRKNTQRKKKRPHNVTAFHPTCPTWPASGPENTQVTCSKRGGQNVCGKVPFQCACAPFFTPYIRKGRKS